MSVIIGCIGRGRVSLSGKTSMHHSPLVWTLLVGFIQDFSAGELTQVAAQI